MRDALLMVAGSGILYAGSTTVGKVALEDGATAFLLVLFRGGVMTATTLSAMIWMHPQPLRHCLGVSRSQVRWLLLRGLNGATAVALASAALAYLPVLRHLHGANGMIT